LVLESGLNIGSLTRRAPPGFRADRNRRPEYEIRTVRIEPGAEHVDYGYRAETMTTSEDIRCC